jgi:hypothetical protein
LAYQLCYAGDCLEEIEQPARTIEFDTDKGTKEVFAFKMPDGKRIEFYSIGESIPDMKGGRPIGPLAFFITVPIAE